jgi:hypothetical protein
LLAFAACPHAEYRRNRANSKRQQGLIKLFENHQIEALTKAQEFKTSNAASFPARLGCCRSPDFSGTPHEGGRQRPSLACDRSDPQQKGPATDATRDN